MNEYIIWMLEYVIYKYFCDFSAININEPWLIKKL